MLTFLNISLFLLSISVLSYSTYSLINIHQINHDVDIRNDELRIEQLKLIKEVNNKKQELELTKQEKTKEQEHLEDIQKNISNTLDNQKELSQKAFENYCEVLENQYKEYEEEYELYKDALETAYSTKQIKLMLEIDEVQKELDKIKETRAAATQALIREKEIEEKLSFYCLQIPEAELRDVAVLDSIKPKLMNPRILSMLIWSTFFQKPMNALCANVIGTGVKSGIYKITNQITKECYIGQAVDLASRFKQHAKRGLNIDTPANNKLYKSMIEYGIWNFSWEVLEEVPPSQLNEKERYYIELYDSYNYGLNQNKGINK